MPNRSKGIVDIRQILHQLRAGVSQRRIARELRINWRTVKKYAGWAKAQGLLSRELPPPEELQHLLVTTFREALPPQNTSTVEPYRGRVLQLRREGTEIAAVWARLQEQGYTGSYGAVYRFVRRLEPGQLDVTVRVETKPGEEGQVDFGYAGLLLDPVSGKLRKAWAFVMTLSWSRHQYVEFVWDQKVETWLLCHRHAFEWFGGVPERLVIDNLKAAVIQACWDDPEVQHAYQECAEHYGFLIGPCRPATPQHKGKVEQGGVHYVKRNFLAGRDSTSITQSNREVRVWCETTAGQRIHGTTKEQPIVRFRTVEQMRLRPLPATPYDLAVWKVAKLHRDCHVVFAQAYYSAPYRLVGQSLRLRGGTQTVQIYTLSYQLVATHDRAQQPGQRQTHPAHLPPELVNGLFVDRATCQAVAQDIGPATSQVVQQLLSDARLDRLPTTRRLLKLRERFGDERLEAACQRALTYAEASYQTIKRILESELDSVTAEAKPIVAPAQTFVRTASELVGHLFGGLTWS
jgi:transposase